MNEIRTAVVIGGTSGVGRAIARVLAAGGAQVTVYGRSLPDSPEENIEYRRFNLLCDDYSAFEAHLNADALIYAAGLGRIAPYERLTDMEITSLFRTNAEGFARVLNLFQPRLLEARPFYCAVLSSIAGLMSSPMFAGYGASKAAVASLCE